MTRYKVGDLARVLGVTTNTIRRYEAAGFIKGERNDSGYRTFSSDELLRSSMIRLLGKCAFSKDNILDMIDSDEELLLKTAGERLNKLDEEIRILKSLRHWLKDNIKMVNTAAEMGDDFIYMDSVAVKYIPCASGFEISDNDEEMKVFNSFMYGSPEVQIMNFYKYEDLTAGHFRPLTSLAIKVSDIERLSLDRNVFDSKYVIEYPSKRSLYGVLRTPSEMSGDNKFYKESRIAFFQKMISFIRNNSERINGDICEIPVNVLGKDHTSFISIPVAKCEGS